MNLGVDDGNIGSVGPVATFIAAEGRIVVLVFGQRLEIGDNCADNFRKRTVSSDI